MQETVYRRERVVVVCSSVTVFGSRDWTLFVGVIYLEHNNLEFSSIEMLVFTVHSRHNASSRERDMVGFDTREQILVGVIELTKVRNSL